MSATGSPCCTAAPPARTLDGAASGRSCGSVAATRFSIAKTSSGGSSTENTVVTASECAPGGRLKLVNDAAASTELGMISRPLPVSICVARQLTSTTRPRADGVSIQSPSWNGCSNSTSRPGDDLADGVLQRQAEHDRRDTQRGEQPADVRRPRCKREHQPDADGDQREPRDVEEDRRNPLAPAAFRRALEQRGVQSGQQQHQHDEAEHRRDDAYRRRLAGHLDRLAPAGSAARPSGRM